MTSGSFLLFGSNGRVFIYTRTKRVTDEKEVAKLDQGKS